MRHVANAAAAARREHEHRSLLCSRVEMTQLRRKRAPEAEAARAKHDSPTLRRSATASGPVQGGNVHATSTRCARRKGQRGAGQSSRPRAAREGVEGVSTCTGEQFARQLMECHENVMQGVTNTQEQSCSTNKHL